MTIKQQGIYRFQLRAIPFGELAGLRRSNAQVMASRFAGDRHRHWDALDGVQHCREHCGPAVNVQLRVVFTCEAARPCKRRAGVILLINLQVYTVFGFIN